MPKRGTSEAATERRKEALQLRIAGASFRAIGRQLGVSGVQAYRDVSAELNTIAKQSLKRADQLRDLELERLDALMVSLWQRARGNPDKGISADLGAVDRILKIVERRAKLLGLDAPVKVAPTTPDGSEPLRIIFERVDKRTDDSDHDSE